MFQAFKHLDFSHDLVNVLVEIFQNDPFDRHELSVGEVESSIDYPELTLADAIAQLLVKARGRI